LFRRSLTLVSRNDDRRGFLDDLNIKMPPLIEEIKKWLAKENPLNFFEDDFQLLTLI